MPTSQLFAASLPERRSRRYFGARSRAPTVSGASLLSRWSYSCMFRRQNTHSVTAEEPAVAEALVVLRGRTANAAARSSVHTPAVPPPPRLSAGSVLRSFGIAGRCVRFAGPAPPPTAGRLQPAADRVGQAAGRSRSGGSVSATARLGTHRVTSVLGRDGRRT